jgi:hypothetical protein
MWRIYADPDSRSWVVLSALLLLMVLVIPNGDGEFGYISLRVSVLPWLALLPVAAKAPLQAPLTRGVIAVALFSSSVGILLAPLPSQIALSSRLEQWSVLGRKMDYGATAMALDFRRFGASSQSIGPDVFMHGVGRIAVDRNLIDVLDYQSRTNHFHITLRPDVDFPVPVQVVLTPERLDPARWADRVRYTIISDLERAPAAWVASLTAHYRLAFEHAGLHLFESKSAGNER